MAHGCELWDDKCTASREWNGYNAKYKDTQIIYCLLKKYILSYSMTPSTYTLIYYTSVYSTRLTMLRSPSLIQSLLRSRQSWRQINGRFLLDAMSWSLSIAIPGFQHLGYLSMMVSWIYAHTILLHIYIYDYIYAYIYNYIEICVYIYMVYWHWTSKTWAILEFNGKINSPKFQTMGSWSM